MVSTTNQNLLNKENCKTVLIKKNFITKTPEITRGTGVKNCENWRKIYQNESKLKAYQ